MISLIFKYALILLAVYITHRLSKNWLSPNDKHMTGKNNNEATRVRKVSVALELGTTDALIGIFVNETKKLIPNEYGNVRTPSCVAFLENGDRLIGEEALLQLADNPENTVCGISRFIGRKWTDPFLKSFMEMRTFKLVNVNGRPHVKVKVGGTTTVIAPEAILAMIIKKLVQTANNILQSVQSDHVEEVVVVIPACYSTSQRQAIVDSCHIAGIKVARLLNKPTAAAISLALNEHILDENIMILSIDGGTIDVSIFTIYVNDIIVLSTTGNCSLGGEEVNKHVINNLVRAYSKKQLYIDTKSCRSCLAKLQREVDRAKRQMTQSNKISVSYETLVEYVTQSDFTEATKELIIDIEKKIDQVMKVANIKRNELNRVFLVEETYQFSYVQDFGNNFFNTKIVYKIAADEEVFINGAIVLANQLGQVSSEFNFFVIDVLSHPIGVKTTKKDIDVVVEQNSPLPVRKAQDYQVPKKGLDSVTINIREGNTIYRNRSETIGLFECHTVSPKSESMENIFVAFAVDINGLLNLTVTDAVTIRPNVLLTDTANLLPEQISQLLQNESINEETFEFRDKKRMEKVRVREDFERIVYLTWRCLTSYHQKNMVASDKQFEDNFALKTVLEEEMTWLDNNLDLSASKLYQRKKKLRDLPIFQAVGKLCENSFIDSPNDRTKEMYQEL